MNFTVEPDHDLKIIRYKHWGTLVSEDIGYVWENKLLNMKEFSEMGYNLFSDYSEAKFNMTPTDVPFIISFMKRIQPLLRGKKQSLLINDPSSTAASLFFENEVNKEIGFIVKVFSTKEAALNWLVNT